MVKYICCLSNTEFKKIDMTKRFKIKGLGLLAILFLLVPLNLYGGTNVEKVMREFQARYHYINPGFYVWPDCYGGPAPSYI